MQTGALIALHLLPTGYSPRRDAVSDYGIGRYRGVFWTQSLAGAVIAGIARLLIPVFPTDPERQPLADRARLDPHDPGDPDLRSDYRRRFKAQLDLRTQPAWHGVQGWLTTLPWVMTGGAVGTLVALRAPGLKRRFGLFERRFYVSSVVWFLIVSIELAHIGH